MADLHKLYKDFEDEITLSPSKQDDLRRGRDALRSRVKKWFKDNKKPQPSFCWQGSFAMKTVVNPLSESEYDLDDGVYLSGYSDKEMDEWVSASTAHTWIYNAVDGHTSSSPINKDTCIRVVYKGSYHIDLPIYIIKDDVAYLAHKSKGWIESDPKAFRTWFLDKIAEHDEQLRSCVKYLKAWKDYKGVPLKGIELTILASENFEVYEGRDDKCMQLLVSSIISSLESSFVCYKPVNPYENLFQGISDTKKTTITNSLKSLKSKIDKALAEEDKEKSSNYLIDVFGDRFPKGDPTPPDDGAKSFVKTSSPGVLKHDGRSAKEY